jgi:hypothetical protein
VHREAGADRRGHRLLDDVRLAGTRVLGRLHDGSLLHPGDAGRDADHHARLGEPPLVDPVDEVAQHLLADLEVRDDPVLQRPDGLDVARGAADHPLGLGADRQRAPVLHVHGDHGGLVEHDAPAADVDEGIGGP